MARRPRSGVSKSAKPSTDGVARDRNPDLNARTPGSQVGVSKCDPAEGTLEYAAEFVTTVASKPEDFYRRNEAVAKKLTGALRHMFAFARQSEVQGRSFGPLQELVVDGLDCESIWAELELRNKALEKHTRRAINRLSRSEHVSLAAEISSSADDVDEARADESDNDLTERAEDLGFIQGVDDDSGSKAETEDGEEVIMKQSRPRGGVMETKEVFFDADDMEEFADEGKPDSDLDDGVLNTMYGEGNIRTKPAGSGGKYSDSDSSEDDVGMEDRIQDSDQTVGGGINYTDFFGDDERLAEDGEESDGNSEGFNIDEEIHEEIHEEKRRGRDITKEQVQERDGEPLEQSQSAHALVTRRLKGKISDQERELVSEKPWALQGEVHAGNRPENSLLEATVDMDRVTRPAPLPTPERATSLLDMIKKRCLDASWDDVTPRNFEGPPVRKEVPELSQERSKEGLGELYEREFLKKTMGVEEADPQAGVKTELKKLFTKLCTKLDALCNFHYTPKAAVPELKVRADVAAIAMEEVLPSSVADAQALAPEEVYAKKRGREAEFLEAGEMGQADRKRARSSKKTARRKAKRQVEMERKLVSRLNPGLGNRYEKSKMLRDIRSAKNVASPTDDGVSRGKEYSSSSKFFTNLQKTVEATIASEGRSSSRSTDESGPGRQAAEFRL